MKFFDLLSHYLFLHGSGYGVFVAKLQMCEMIVNTLVALKQYKV